MLQLMYLRLKKLERMPDTQKLADVQLLSRIQNKKQLNWPGGSARFVDNLSRNN